MLTQQYAVGELLWIFFNMNLRKGGQSRGILH